MTTSTTDSTVIRFDAQQFDLSRVTVGLSWRIARPRQGFFKRLLGAATEGFDLDAAAILLDAADKLRDFGGVRDLGAGRKVGLIDSDVIFYNNLQHPSGALWHTGDDLKAGNAKDNEQLILNLLALPEVYTKVLFPLSIHQGQFRGQHLGLVRQLALDMRDATGMRIGQFSLTDTQAFAGQCTVVVAALHRLPGAWELRQVLQGYESDSFVEVLRSHV
jgi:tellurium resistance protein TerD